MEEKDLSKSLETIPEFFFDIIARIPSGMLFSVLIYTVIYNQNLKEIWTNISFGNLLVVLLISYTVGILLSAPAKFMAKIYFKRVWKRIVKREKNVIDKFLLIHPLENISGNLDELDSTKYLYLYRETHDYSKNYNPIAKVMLPKLSAESSLANNLATAIILFLLLLLFVDLSKIYPIINIWNYFWLLPVCALLVWIAAERYDRLLGSQFSFLKIILNSKNSSNQEINSTEKLSWSELIKRKINKLF